MENTEPSELSSVSKPMERPDRCPHCAHRPFLSEMRQDDNTLDWRVWCDHCGALGPNRETKTNAVVAWNTRTSPSDPSDTDSSSASSVSSPENFTEHLCTLLEDFVNNATDAEMEQAFKDSNFELYRHVKGDPTGLFSSSAAAVSEEERWTVVYEGNSNLHYVCSGNGQGPVIDYGFDRKDDARAFAGAHSASLERVKKDTSEIYCETCQRARA